MSARGETRGSSRSLPAGVVSVEGGAATHRSDEIAAEEPLEIRVVTIDGAQPVSHGIAVTMRTPGHDRELAAGFLFTEGIVQSADAIRKVSHCVAVAETARQNVVSVVLAPGTPFDPERFTRNVYTSSSCGVCGKTSLDMVRVAMPGRLRPGPVFRAETLLGLPRSLGERQTVFARTGGLHAAALFDPSGQLILASEDVGRHNAMDKIVGTLLMRRKLPAHDAVVLVSGRASYELVQKALMAGIPVLAAVGAPSSLAVSLSEELGMTLVGFLRDSRFNIYSGEERIALTADGTP
ncbi:MAG: formate dehydrogenase accessory sulfurtransferase FdhD [Acidobacteriota bacterium]|nr:formate dehydrogenase accessory sulfurtransferase FdhD [Acidobacteriota bacterium]